MNNWLRGWSLIYMIATATLSLGATPSLARSQVDIVTGSLPKSAKTMLDLNMVCIDIRGVTMQTALTKISHAIEAQSSGKLHLSYGTEPSEQFKLSNRNVPQYHVWKLYDPKVELHAGQTTLREVFNNLCFQSQWSYKLIGQIIYFSDSTRYAFPAR